jgi:hypothetical protein
LIRDGGWNDLNYLNGWNSHEVQAYFRWRRISLWLRRPPDACSSDATSG